MSGISPIENIMAALFTLVSAGSEWKTKSRRLRLWSDVATADKPALFLAQGNLNAVYQQKLPTIWTINADVYIYVSTGGDETSVPSTILNPLLDRVIANLLPLPYTNNEQTLGGLVTACRIDGQIETDEGTLGDEAVAIIPLKIILPQ